MSYAIRFESVSKAYRLGERQRSLRTALTQLGRSLRPRRSNNENSILWALDDVSFEVAPGEALGFIGPNGAGKTTILKLLSKITQPTTGHITVNGRLSALIELGAGFHPELTGRENIYLNAAILGLPLREVDRLFDRIVAFSGLERFIDTPVKRYSSGMYVRLGFSVAAHVEPDVLLVDEVLAVGDAQFRQRCARRIEELRRRGTTIVFISHNLPLVRSICDGAIFLDRGRVQAQGEVVEVINAYESHQRQMETGFFAANVLDGPEPAGSPAVEITQVEIRSLDGKRADELCHTDAAEVRVHFLAREPIARPKLNMRIIRADGTTCCRIRTADYGCTLDDLDGQGVISVAVDSLQLAGGAYVIDARLLGALDGVALAQRHSQWFQVGGLSSGREEWIGVFVPRLAWARVEQASQNGLSIDDASSL